MAITCHALEGRERWEREVEEMERQRERGEEKE